MKITCENCGLEQNVDRHPGGAAAGQELGPCSQCGASLELRPKGPAAGMKPQPDGHVPDH